MNLRITVHYSAQARQAAGTNAERVELPAPATLADLLTNLAERHTGLTRLMLGTCEPAGAKPALLVFVGDRQVRLHDPSPLRDGDEVTLLPPISGG